MRYRAGLGKGFLAATLGALLVLVSAQVLALSEAEKRGKQIYLGGTSDRGNQIDALVGREGLALPASAVPCASCHGTDGKGRPEGGLIPPDVRWSELTKVYGHVHEEGRRQGRRHPAFDEASLAKVLRTGVDPGDNRLDYGMPRYEMPDDDMADLIAYLKRLETDLDPGLSDDRIQVGTLLPLDGPRGRLGQAMAQVLHAHFEEVNKSGGVFGRRLELLVVPFGQSPSSTLANLSQALQSEGIFALVGTYSVGMDEQLLDLLRPDQIPLVGPFTLDPGDEIVDAEAFYLYPGFNEQARVLADHAVGEQTDKRAPLLIVGPEVGRVNRLVEAVRDQVGDRVETQPVSLRYPEGEMRAEELAARVQESGGESMFFFGKQDDLEPLLGALAARGQAPRVYVLSSFVSARLLEAPASFHYRIFLAYPTLSSDVSAEGRAAYQDLSSRYALPRDHLQAQIAAFAAARLLVEGLRRAGRDLNRERLVERLEELYSYKTGLTPPLTYGPNRRIGARGGYVVAVDLIKKSHETVGGWREVR